MAPTRKFIDSNYCYNPSIAIRKTFSQKRFGRSATRPVAIRIFRKIALAGQNIPLRGIISPSTPLRPARWNW